MSEDKKVEELNNITCPTCGILFGFLKTVESIWRDNHKSFHCPNGHSMSWTGETSEQKELKQLRSEVEGLKAKLETALKEVEIQKKRADDLALELEIWKPSEEKTA